MPSTKRRRASRDSSASSRAASECPGSDSPRPHKSARVDIYEDKENHDSRESKEPISSEVEYVGLVPHRGCAGGFSPVSSDKRKVAPYEYICFHRPLFDVDGENWRNWSEGKGERLEKHDLYTQLYKPGHVEENKKGIWAAPPSKHKNHKWVIMWSAWLRFDGFCRRAKYCDPDNFDMNLYTDWKGWGMQDIVDNAIVDFDKAFKKKSPTRLDEMWSVLSAIGLWSNVEDVSELINSDDGDKTCEMIGLIGCALLTALSAIDRAGELKPSSRFLDLALVIGYYLELSHDLPAYGIEGACVCWRREAVLLFKKAKLDPSKGLFDTDKRLQELETAPSIEPLNSDDETDDEEENAKLLHHEHGTDTDPWAWEATMGKYRKSYGNTMGLQQYDITRFTRAQRAEASYSGRDPLADVPVKDLRRNLLDFV